MWTRFTPPTTTPTRHWFSAWRPLTLPRESRTSAALEKAIAGSALRSRLLCLLRSLDGKYAQQRGALHSNSVERFLTCLTPGSLVANSME